MFLKRISIKNFRGLRELELQLDETTVLIGSNNTGKTSILEALQACMSRTVLRRNGSFVDYDYHLSDGKAQPQDSPPIAITLTFVERENDEWPDALVQILNDVINTHDDGSQSIVLEVVSSYDVSICDYLTKWRFLNPEGNVLPLLRNFFDPFLFEDLPASDRRADEVYLAEVASCDTYLGLFGNQYGFEDANGLSATHLEYNEAGRLHKHRLIFLIGPDDKSREAKMLGLVRQAGNQLMRRRVSSIPPSLQPDSTQPWSNTWNRLESYLAAHSTPHAVEMRPLRTWTTGKWPRSSALPGARVIFHSPTQPAPPIC